MVYKATQDVVRRVMPLLERMATRTIDRARLLQYLSARAGVDWGVLELVSDTGADAGSERELIFRDRGTRAEHAIRYPSCLPDEVEPLVREEYKRLAADRPLSLMAEPLFAYFFQAEYCDRCRWRSEAHAQFHRECRFAGHPVNFEPDPTAEAGPNGGLLALGPG
ncbi:MAG: hypothetical protein M3Q03_16220 [Chloroflexota bacterium]|nr:hypothetical protein [Chloroflexota bacterium]